MDYVALTNIKEKAEPIRLVPDDILNKGKPDPEALKNLINPDKFLVSLPGSEYKFNFTLPDQNSDFELFLYSKGYYLEWIRDNWIKEKNLMKLWQMVNLPNKYLKDEAKSYKHWESNMEREFWGSKIDPELLSNHEN